MENVELKGGNKGELEVKSVSGVGKGNWRKGNH